MATSGLSYLAKRALCFFAVTVDGNDHVSPGSGDAKGQEDMGLCIVPSSHHRRIKPEMRAMRLS